MSFQLIPALLNVLMSVQLIPDVDNVPIFNQLIPVLLNNPISVQLILDVDNSPKSD